MERSPFYFSSHSRISLPSVAFILLSNIFIQWAIRVTQIKHKRVFHVGTMSQSVVPMILRGKGDQVAVKSAVINNLEALDRLILGLLSYKLNGMTQSWFGGAICSCKLFVGNRVALIALSSQQRAAWPPNHCKIKIWDWRPHKIATSLFQVKVMRNSLADFNVWSPGQTDSGLSWLPHCRWFQSGHGAALWLKKLIIANLYISVTLPSNCWGSDKLLKSYKFLKCDWWRGI